MAQASAVSQTSVADELSAWLARYGPVEREVIEAHEAAVRFGSMVQDLECYVDNSLLRDEAGAIVGRRGGVKAWLQVNIPALYVRYTTVMRYKAMAKKLMQVTGLADPVPAAAVLMEPERGKGSGCAEDGCTGDRKQDYGTYEIEVVAADGAETGGRLADVRPEERWGGRDWRWTGR